jgi:hypothetical protein
MIKKHGGFTLSPIFKKFSFFSSLLVLVEWPWSKSVAKWIPYSSRNVAFSKENSSTVCIKP